MPTETKRIALSTILASRDPTTGKDGLLVNCYAEQGPDAKRVVKRAGTQLYANIGDSLCPGQGAAFFIGGPVFIVCDTLITDVTPIPPPPPCTLGIVPVAIGTSETNAFLPNITSSLGGASVSIPCRPTSGIIWLRYYNTSGSPEYFTISALDIGSATLVRNFSSTIFNFTTYATVIDVDPGDGSAFVAGTGNRIYKLFLDGTINFIDTLTNLAPKFVGAISAPAWNLGSQLDMWILGSGGIFREWNIAWTIGGMTPSETFSPSGNLPSVILRNGAGIGDRVYYTCKDNSIRYVDTALAIGETIAVPAGNVDSQIAVVGFDGNLYGTNFGSSTLKKFSADGTLLGSVVIPGLSRVFIYDTKGYVWTDGQVGGFITYNKVKASTMTVEATVTDLSFGSTDIVGEPLAGVPAVNGAPFFADLQGYNDNASSSIGIIDCLP